METIFNPESIVVIGVSEDPNNLARNILANLISFNYKGQIFAVGREAGEAFGFPIHASMQTIPDRLDLAVILTPASSVPDLIDACGRKGIRRVVIESGGFREYSETGKLLEQEIMHRAQHWNIRIVGPNCISVINLESGVCLPFAPVLPDSVNLGPASVISQSGGISLTYLDRLCQAGVGVNKVVSIGNKADYIEVDYLKYMLRDPGTKMVCLYLESLEDGRRLMDLAAQASKPVIIHKANRAKATRAIAFSHTGALADDDRIVEAAFRQAGVIRAQSFRDTTAVVQGFMLPPVQGSRLVILSRSGGHAVAAADAAQRYGFHLIPIPDDFADAVRQRFRKDVIAITNPIDLGAIFDFDVYADIAEQALTTLPVDAVLMINTFSRNEAQAARRLVNRVASIVRRNQLPIAMCNFPQGSHATEPQDGIDIPLFEEIEDALRGLSASRWWLASRRSSPAGGWSRGEGSALARDEHIEHTPITAPHALRLCQSYGIPSAEFGTAEDPVSAGQLAKDIGFPVAVKLISEDALHKSDMGAVELGLADEQSVLTASTRLIDIASSLEVRTAAILMVQQMVEGGIEVVLGSKRDPTFGPVVIFGFGGTLVEIMDDISFRVVPLSRQDAESMIDELRGSTLLEGARGARAINRQALVDAILSFSNILLDRPDLMEIEVNPLILQEDRILAVDARAATATAPA